MRFVRENRQMTNKKLYCEDVLQMFFDDSDSEGEYLPFGNDDRPSNDRASLLCNGAVGHGESVHNAQTSDNFALCPMGMGVAGVDVVFLIAHAQRAAGVMKYSVSEIFGDAGRSIHEYS